MKTFFGMTAAVLLVVSLLFVSVPGAATASKVTLAEMVSIKKAADEAAQAAKAQAEKAKTVGEKRLAKQLLKQAESNAEVAADLLEAVQEGEDVDREQAEACAAIAKAVNEAAGALAAGNMGKAEGAMGRIGELGSSLPTAGNARAEMQRAAGADKAGKNQTVTAGDMNKKGKTAELGSSLPTAANARAEMQRDRARNTAPYLFCEGNTVMKVLENGRKEKVKKCKICESCVDDLLGKAWCEPNPCKASPSHPKDCPCPPAK